MKRLVLILCVLGLVFLIVGSVLAVVSPFPSKSIPCTGTIVYPNDSPSATSHSEEAQSQVLQKASSRAQEIGYIIVGIGFFVTAFLYNRKSKVITP